MASSVGIPRLVAVKQLVLRDFRCGGLVLDHGGIVLHVDVGERVRPAVGPQQQRVALRVVAHSRRLRQHLDQAAVGIGAPAGRDTLADYGRAGIAADMYHLGAGVGLLAVARHGHGVELTHRAIALEHARGVFPCDGRAGLYLGPRQLGIVAAAQSALGHEIVHAAAPLGIAGIPVLHGAVLDLGAVLAYYLHDGRVQLVLVARRSRAALQITHIGVVVGHDERALKLARAGRVDAEVGRQLHGGSAHPWGCTQTSRRKTPPS